MNLTLPVGSVAGNSVCGSVDIYDNDNLDNGGTLEVSLDLAGALGVRIEEGMESAVVEVADDDSKHLII